MTATPDTTESPETDGNGRQPLALFALGVGLYAFLHFGVVIFFVPVVEKMARQMQALPVIVKFVVAYSNVVRSWFIPSMVVSVLVLPGLTILLARKVSPRTIRRFLAAVFMLITLLSLLVGVAVALVLF